VLYGGGRQTAYIPIIYIIYIIRRRTSEKEKYHIYRAVPRNLRP
jgi:hypothetical protein